MPRQKKIIRQVPLNTGPGTVYYRFSWLMDELDKRYPDPDSYSSSSLPEKRVLQEIDNERIRHLFEVEQLRAALNAAVIALDDWTNLYASEFCNEERVKEAQARIEQYGTLYYIASVVKKSRDALKDTQWDKNTSSLTIPKEPPKSKS
jgi:hypothetical protein